jgi:ribosomal protein S18 acetylase RimI-like enzyme
MKKATIRNITQEELLRYFYKLAAEVECGNHFDFTNPRHEQWLRRKHAVYEFQGARFFASFLEDGAPVGYGVLLIEEPLENVNQVFGQKTELLAIGVSSDFRGTGHGKELLDYAEEFSRKIGAYTMYISTYARDYKVIAFYGRNGYVPVATLPDVHGQGDDGLVYMRKIINKS